MNDNSARHIFILIAIALAMLVAASLIPWSDMTGNRLKDFNLLEDVLPRPDHVAASASMITDPELRELMAEAVEAPADDNAVPSDSAAADTVVWIPPVTEAPRVDGHVVVESYTGDVPLARFRAALAQAGRRLVRVAVVGDSFIEGDIFTQDLRALLQEAYGGRGTGYMTIHSEMPGFRRSVRQSGGKLCIYVAPHLVDGENPLAGVEDVFNAITVRGNAVGDVMFYGRGAGKRPTASAVVADVIDIAKDLKKDRRNCWGPGAPDLVVSSDILTSQWYVRAQAPMDQARLACGEIQPLARSGAPAGEVAFLTAPMSEPQIKDKLKGMDVGSLFRVLD